MTRERWLELEKKFAPLGVSFNPTEFAYARCLRCAQVVVGLAFFCESCLLRFGEQGLDHLKYQEYLALITKMITLGVLSDKDDCLLPNFDPEFTEYIRECVERDYGITGIERRAGFRNPDAINFFRFYVGNRVKR